MRKARTLNEACAHLTSGCPVNHDIWKWDPGHWPFNEPPRWFWSITAKTGLLRAPPLLCGVRAGLGSSGPSALWCPRTSRQGLPWHLPSAHSSDRPPAVAFISQPFHPLPRRQGLLVLFSLLGTFCLPHSSYSFHRSQFKEFFLEEPSFSVRLALCTLVARYGRNSHGAL